MRVTARRYALLLAQAWMALSLAAPELSGCTGTMVTTVPSEPREEAIAQARDSLHGARDLALETSEDQDVLTFAARHNPAECECPDWEIALRGRWTRVFLEIPLERPDLLATLTAPEAAEPDDDGPRTWSLTGRLADDWRLDEITGLRYPVLAVEAITER